MGSKRRWRSEIDGLLPATRGALLCDAGPWGQVWRAIQVDARGVAQELRSYHRDARVAWTEAYHPPVGDLVRDAAQYLVLQARTPSGIPIWWDGERWVTPTGTKTEAAHARGGRVTFAGPKPGNGLVHTETLARRAEALARLADLEVWRGDCRAVEPFPAVVLLDPPYVGAPRYAELLPRRDVLDLVQRWSAAGADVVVCEGEPIPGMHHHQLAPREWLSATWPIARQGALFSGAA